MLLDAELLLLELDTMEELLLLDEADTPELTELPADETELPELEASDLLADWADVERLTDEELPLEEESEFESESTPLPLHAVSKPAEKSKAARNTDIIFLPIIFSSAVAL